MPLAGFPVRGMKKIKLGANRPGKEKKAAYVGGVGGFRFEEVLAAVVKRHGRRRAATVTGALIKKADF